VRDVLVEAPETFLNGVLWPEFQQINAALTEYLAQVRVPMEIERPLRSNVNGDSNPN